MTPTLCIASQPRAVVHSGAPLGVARQYTLVTSRAAVAIYARISRDPSGDMLGVTRQLEDCRAEAERRGWTVAEEYVDDDTSAYSGKTRPAYERLQRDIGDGLPRCLTEK